MYINLAVFFFVLAIQNIECGRFNISYEGIQIIDISKNII